MDLQKIKALIDFAAEARLSYLEFEEQGCTLRLARDAGGVAVPAATIATERDSPASVAEAAAPPDSTAVPGAIAAPDNVVTAPMYGLLYLSPSPDEPPFVQVGDAVCKGQKLCLLEAMKVFHAVVAARDGVVDAILAGEGQEVDAGQPLFRID